MTKKLAISLPDDVAEEVRQAVELGEAPSVSAYIADAVRAYQPPQDFGEFLAQWRRETGPSSPEEKARLAEQLAAIGIQLEDGELDD